MTPVPFGFMGFCAWGGPHARAIPKTAGAGRVAIAVAPEGPCGEPLYVPIELWRRPYRLGADGWRYDIARVGNWVLEEPIHFFDLARWYLAGRGDAVSVYARANSRQPEHPELHDNFSAVVN